MPTVLLVRHGRTTANASGVLAGWTPGVLLDDHGVAAGPVARAAAGAVPVSAVVSSPLERCRQTAEHLTSVPGPQGAARPEVVTDERLGECRYGDWTGRELKTLVKDPLWKVVQQHPSAAVFPGAEGESMRAMQQRALDAVRDWDARVAAEHGDDAVWVAVLARRRHQGDPRRRRRRRTSTSSSASPSSPASVSAVRYTATRPFLLRSNDAGGDLSGVRAPRRARRHASRASRARTPSSAVTRRCARRDVGSCPCPSSSTTRPSASSPARSASPDSARSTCRPSRGGRVTSVALEKQQVAVLAERVDQLLDEVVRRSGGQAAVPAVAPGELGRHRAARHRRSRRTSGSAR